MGSEERICCMHVHSPKRIYLEACQYIIHSQELNYSERESGVIEYDPKWPMGQINSHSDLSTLQTQAYAIICLMPFELTVIFGGVHSHYLAL